MSELKKKNQPLKTAATGRDETLKRLAAVEAENGDLRRRLAESEARIQALTADGVGAGMESGDELQRSRQQTTDILSSIKDGVLALDREWRFLYVNQHAAQNVNYRPEDLIGKNLWEVFPQYLGTVYEEKYRQAMEERKTIHFEVAGIIQKKFYEISIYPSAEGIDIYWQDISERKQAELALEKRTRPGAKLPEHRRNHHRRPGQRSKGVFDQRQRAARSWGVRKNEILGANWFDTFIPERMRAEIKAGFAQLLAGQVERFDYFENPVLTKDGEERLIAWSNVSCATRTERSAARSARVKTLPNACAQNRN